VHSWHARWRQGGTDALRSGGPTGPTPRLSDRQLGQVEHVLLEGATANVRLGWTVQRPVRQAAERDQDAIERWVKETWRRIKQTPIDAKPVWSSSTRARSA
jgi:transposase